MNKGSARQLERQIPTAGITRRQILAGASLLGLGSLITIPLLVACTKMTGGNHATPAGGNAELKPTVSASNANITPVSPRYKPKANVDLPPTQVLIPPTPIATGDVEVVVRAGSTEQDDATDVSSSEKDYLFSLTERQKIAHLLRRAAFGFDQAELDASVETGIDMVIGKLVDFEKIDETLLVQRIVNAGLDFELPQELRRWWYLRMTYSPRPLEERLLLFWHGILTSSLKKVGRPSLMMAQNSLLRQLGSGSYELLLKRIGRDPAMLIWLDSRSNRKRAPNENYARELMELFTLGPGYFSEEDVRESARAFTGWGLSKPENRETDPTFLFDETQHDYDEKSFLTNVGHFDGDDVVDIILNQEQAPRFVSTKLWEFFAYDDPESEVIDRLADVFVSSGYLVKEVVRAIFHSPEFYSERAYRTQIKSPLDLLIQTSKALQFDTNGKGFTSHSDRMGQIMFAPPDVNGWPGGTRWINSSAMLQRANFAHQIVLASRSAKYVNGDPVTYSRTELTDLLLDGVADPAMDEALDYFESATHGLHSQGVYRGMLYLFLAGPAYQRG